MALVTEYSKLTASHPGWNNVNFEVGSATAFPQNTGGEKLLGYTVPAGVTFECRGLNISGYAARNLPTLAAVYRMGTVKLRQNSVDVWEGTLQQISLPSYITGGNELVNPKIVTSQVISFGDGLVFVAGQPVALTVTPQSASYGARFYATLHGATAGVPDVRFGELTPTATTANQVICGFTPAADYTLYSIDVSGELFGALLGSVYAYLNGAIIFDMNMLTMDDTCPMLCEDTFPSGCLPIPLDGLTLSAGDRLEVWADFPAKHGGCFVAQLVGQTTEIGGASGGGLVMSVCE